MRRDSALNTRCSCSAATEACELSGCGLLNTLCVLWIKGKIYIYNVQYQEDKVIELCISFTDVLLQPTMSHHSKGAVRLKPNPDVWVLPRSTLWAPCGFFFLGVPVSFTCRSWFQNDSLSVWMSLSASPNLISREKIRQISGLCLIGSLHIFHTSPDMTTIVLLRAWENVITEFSTNTCNTVASATGTCTGQ